MIGLQDTRLKANGRQIEDHDQPEAGEKRGQVHRGLLGGAPRKKAATGNDQENPQIDNHEKEHEARSPEAVDPGALQINPQSPLSQGVVEDAHHIGGAPGQNNPGEFLPKTGNGQRDGGGVSVRQ